MEMTAIANLFHWFSPLRLAGPIFEKELRVASRRRRLYVLRLGYMALLVVMLLGLWYAVPRSRGAAVVQVSRLGELGKQIAVAVIWLQFLTGQLLAIVLLGMAAVPIALLFLRLATERVRWNVFAGEYG